MASNSRREWIGGILANGTMTPINQTRFIYESLVTGATGFGRRPLIVFSLPTVGKTHLVENLNAEFGRENGIAVDLDYRAPKTLISRNDNVRELNAYLINNFVASGQIKLITTFVDWVDLEVLNTRAAGVIFVVPQLTAEEAVARELHRNGGCNTPFSQELARDWDVWKMKLEATIADVKFPCKVIRTQKYLSDELASMFADYQDCLDSVGCEDRIYPETPFTKSVLQEIWRYIDGNQ